jgi:Trk K+ transport system NAD-binding subunit/nucleotide-binding universal stress UspA family protein
MATLISGRKRVLIVGASDTTQALVAALGTTWEVVVLELDPARLQPLREHPQPDTQVQLLVKDGTSLLNLQAAGLTGADWVIAVTEIDAVNIEVCRLALSIENPPKAVGVVGHATAQTQLKNLGAEALLRPGAMAGLLVNVIETGLRVAVSVGLGRGEILEIPVLPSSPAVNVRVADLRARRWLIAAIYRGEQIIVPHGDAVIRSGDRLLLSGEPDILPDIAEYLRSGVARFPLQYGRKLVAVDDGRLGAGFWQELHFLATRTRLTELNVLSRLRGPTSLRPELDWPTSPGALQYKNRLPAYLRAEQASLECGCLVIPKRRSGLGSRIGLWRPPYAQLLEQLPCPTLLAAGNPPYKRILLPVDQAHDLRLSTELAIDLSRQLAAPLVAVTVSPPEFVSGDEQIAEQAQALKTVKDVAAQYRVPVEMQHKNGNPVRELAAFAQPDDLLVLSNRARHRTWVLRPDTGMLVIEHVPCSVLVLTGRAPESRR